MKFRPAALLLILTAALGAAEEGPAIRSRQIGFPVRNAHASSPSLARHPDGTVWLTWLEGDAHRATLRYATYDSAAAAWREPRTAATGSNWVINSADLPAITIGREACVALWMVSNGPAAPGTPAAHDHEGPGSHAVVARSADGGKTWGPATPLTTESTTVEFASLTTLADGRVLGVWLDGRAKKAGGKRQQLYGRIIGESGPDTLIDPSVCDCCQTTLTAFPDGSALLAYRGRTDNEVRDIRATRFRNGSWEKPRPVNNDEWRITGCPVNGPHLTSDGGRVAVAWYTGADNDPRVLASFSSDAGERFLLPVRISDEKTLGHATTALLHDGAFVVTFVDADGALWLRRVTPDFAATAPVRLTDPAAGRVKGLPRLVLARDYEGGNATADLIVAYAQEKSAEVRTLLVTVPEGELLAAEKNCDCNPTPEQLRGFPIRGTITAPAADGVVRVQHIEVPGIFGAGTREFRAPPEVLARASDAGRQFLGRVEQRDGVWWLTDLRLIATAPR